MIKYNIRGYEYLKPDMVYPLDSKGNKITKHGIGKIRQSLGGAIGIPFQYKLTSKGKDMLTSKFITESGFRFTSIKLRNQLLKH